MLKYSIGNKKIGRDTIIFNMGSASNCPSDELGYCDFGNKGNKKCYALKSERLWPQVLPYRNAQEEYWKNTEREQIAEDVLTALGQHRKIKFVRFNESGDFWGIECIEKLGYIATKVNESFPKVKIYGYSNRKDLRNFFHLLPKNVIVNGSGFMIHNEYKVDLNVNKKDKPTLARKQMVCLDDCSVCNLCKVRHGKTITQTLH